MSKDIIYREDAIKAINLRARIPHDVASAHYASMAINAIRSVPSADRPKSVDLTNVYQTAYDNGYARGKADRPRGEWENYKDEHRCSNCGEVVIGDWYDTDNWYDFCPNCGARMKGADDDR